MADIQINDNYLDFYSQNSDYTGFRQLKNKQEVVEYQNASTMRIWFNEQNFNYPQHWHSAMEIIMPVEAYYDAYIKDTLYRVNPGEVLVIPPGEVHMLSAPENGQVVGIVQSVVFKGVHYEMMIKTENFTWMVHSTESRNVGDSVGLSVIPFDIHIMKTSPEPVEREG